MEPFATLGDLESYLGRTLNAERAELLLDLASHEIRAFLRQQVNRVEADVIALPTRGGAVLALPELPVWDVTDVVVRELGGDPTTLTVDDFELIDGHDGRIGQLRRLKRLSWPADGFATVTYDHGYDVPGSSAGAEHPLPDVFRTRTILIAARALANPTGNRQEAIGRYSYTAGGAGDALGLALTAGDQDALAGYMPGTVAGARG